MERVVRFAARELARYTAEMTGKVLSGIGLTVDPLLAYGSMDPRQDDLYTIDVCAGKGTIRGINGRSVLQGVYRFLRECGCVFVRPGKDGDSIPHRSAQDCTVRLRCRPAHRFRAITIEGSVLLDQVLDLIDWSAKNGFNSYFTQFRHSNTFFERRYGRERNEFAAAVRITDSEASAFVKQIASALKQRGMLFHAVGHGWTCESIGYEPRGWHTVPDGEIPDDVRSFLAQVGGRRKFHCDVPLNTQLCYSDPEVQKRIVCSVCDYAQDHPEVDFLHVWLGDGNNNFCECERCAQKSPHDWYVVILNRIDSELTARGLQTRIVFLLYNELLWPPVCERLHNPDRFVMMFAPISRSYTESFAGERYEPGSRVELPVLRLNRNEFPAGVRDNLKFLYANYPYFSGDAFDFDYHLMWEPYKDLGGMQLADVIRKDVQALHDIGLNGLVSCQVQKIFAPHGFALYVMGHMLEDPSQSFESLKDTYFTAAFGSHVQSAYAALAVFEETGCAEYLRHACKEVDPACAERFRQGTEKLLSHADALRALGEAEPDRTVALSLDILAYYCRLCSLYFVALAEKASGKEQEKQQAFCALHRFLFEQEEKYDAYIDSYFFDVMADAMLNASW